MDDMVPVIEVVLLTQDDCKFCDDAKTVLGRLGREFRLRVDATDLNSTRGQALALEGGLLFPPGIVINGRPFSYGRPSEKRLRREFERLSAVGT